MNPQSRGAMSKKKEPRVWDVATAAEMEAAFKVAGVALTAQDAGLKYTGAINASSLFGDRTFLGDSDPNLFSPAASRELVACKERVAASGQGERVDVELTRDGGSQWQRLWVEPLALGNDQRGVLCAALNVTEQRVAEEHLRLALLELAHRSKNLLAVILSIARQSADDSDTLSQFSTRFVGRIRSLALAHDVLTDESWRGATVFSLVRSQLSAFSDTAVAQSTVQGHNAYLKPNAVQYVGLALHELIAQSLLSGALSTPEGRIHFSSALGAPSDSQEAPPLVLTWEESGIADGPAEKSLFGHALLERILPTALAGTATFDTSRHGLAYVLSIPASQYF
jgi:two-component sensor histidine kinase